MIKKQIIAGFNRGAKTYAGAADVQAEVASRLSRYFSTIHADTVLEIGCGTGLLSQHLLTAFPQATFLLTDISPVMIDQCQKQMAAFPNVSFSCMDAETPNDLPSFDLIVSSMTFHWFSQFQSTLEAIMRKLNRGGRLIFATLTDHSFHEWHTLCRDGEHAPGTPHFPALEKIKKTFPDMKFEVQTIKKIYPDLYTFLKTLKDLGATAAREEYVPLSSGQMRKWLRHFNQEIEMTYEVLYGVYRVS